MSLYEAVYKFKTKYPEGFTDGEIEQLLKDYPEIKKDKFNDTLQGCTGIIKKGEFITYHCDILTALRCGIYNREIFGYEFD